MWVVWWGAGGAGTRGARRLSRPSSFFSSLPHHLVVEQDARRLAQHARPKPGVDRGRHGHRVAARIDGGDVRRAGVGRRRRACRGRPPPPAIGADVRIRATRVDTSTQSIRKRGVERVGDEGGDVGRAGEAGAVGRRDTPVSPHGFNPRPAPTRVAHGRAQGHAVLHGLHEEVGAAAAGGAKRRRRRKAGRHGGRERERGTGRRRGGEKHVQAPEAGDEGWGDARGGGANVVGGHHPPRRARVGRERLRPVDIERRRSLDRHRVQRIRQRGSRAAALADAWRAAADQKRARERWRRAQPGQRPLARHRRHVVWVRVKPVPRGGGRGGDQRGERDIARAKARPQRVQGQQLQRHARRQAAVQGRFGVGRKHVGRGGGGGGFAAIDDGGRPVGRPPQDDGAAA